MRVTVSMSISLVLILGDLNCCVAVARARFVVLGQNGLVDLGDRRTDGGFHAPLEAHLAGKVAGIERSADGLGRSLKALVERCGSLALGQIKVSEVHVDKMHVLGR